MLVSSCDVLQGCPSRRRGGSEGSGGDGGRRGPGFLGAACRVRAGDPGQGGVGGGAVGGRAAEPCVLGERGAGGLRRRRLRWPAGESGGGGERAPVRVGGARV